MRWAFRILSGLCIVTFGYIWTVGQGGFGTVNNNLCDLWKDTFGQPPSCQFNKVILRLWGIGALAAALFLIFDLARWLRKSGYLAKFRAVTAGLVPKKQQTEPPLPARISLLDLLSDATTRGWVFDNRDPLHEFTHGLQQAASEGSVVIWGIDVKNGSDLKSAPRIYVAEKIVASYFKEHWIDARQGQWHKDNSYTRTSLPSGNEPRFYSNLHVERESALAWLSGAAEHIRKSYYG
jgi:hypothetical protein